MADNQAPIIIKKVKKGGDHGHHGGAWKLAYADFVTAMMAFFLLLWLLSATTTEQKQGIADYFAPTFASKSTNGANGVLGGNSVTSDNGAQSSGSVVVTLTPPSASTSNDDNSQAQTKPNDDEVNKAIAEREEQAFKDAEKELTQAIQNTASLKDFADNLIIDRTPEGMRIQIVDQDRKSMFASGSAEPLQRTKEILQLVAKIILKLPNRISIAGHTDATPFSGRADYSNWELSSDRANASRRVLLDAGVPASRIAEVKGMAATEPLFPEDPMLPSNRRISITLLREAPVLPPNYR
jgi:chemotaxis protein MotB